MGDALGLSVPAQLTDRNSSVRLFEVSNRGHPHLRPAASADFLWLGEASTRGFLHFHTVLLDKTALQEEIQGRDALADDQGNLTVTRALFPKNYPETSWENVICVHQRPPSPVTNMLDLLVWKLVALPDKKLTVLSRSAPGMLGSSVSATALFVGSMFSWLRSDGPGGRLRESSKDAMKNICLAYSKQVQHTILGLCLAYSRQIQQKIQ